MVLWCSSRGHASDAPKATILLKGKAGGTVIFKYKGAFAGTPGICPAERIDHGLIIEVIDEGDPTNRGVFELPEELWEYTPPKNGLFGPHCALGRATVSNAGAPNAISSVRTALLTGKGAFSDPVQGTRFKYKAKVKASALGDGSVFDLANPPVGDLKVRFLTTKATFDPVEFCMRFAKDAIPGTSYGGVVHGAENGGFLRAKNPPHEVSSIFCQSPSGAFIDLDR